jgi:hypothetical protein
VLITSNPRQTQTVSFCVQVGSLLLCISPELFVTDLTFGVFTAWNGRTIASYELGRTWKEAVLEELKKTRKTSG